MVTDRRRNRAVIFELKHVKKTDFKTEDERQKNISDVLEAAAAQMKSRGYGSDFQGELELLPIAACGKEFYLSD